MGTDNFREREDRAFEAFLVSQMRRNRDINNLDDLPDLTQAERMAMNNLPADLVEKLWDVLPDDDETALDEQSCDEMHIEQPAASGMNRAELAAAGMNRAEEMDEETRNKLAAARKKIADQIRKKRKGDANAKS